MTFKLAAHGPLGPKQTAERTWPERSCRGCEPCSPSARIDCCPARALTCCGEPCTQPAAAVIYFFSIASTA